VAACSELTDEGKAMETKTDDQRMTRRGSLLRLAGLAATLGGGAAWEATSAHGAGPAAVSSGLVSCVLAPELTEGPYYIAGEKVRRNITEGKPGTPLTLKLTAINASTCKPIPNAAVDIWHCDAGGVYSGFGAASTGGPGGGSGPTDKLTFMRGIQKSNAAGIATFQTIYPGWYRGRAVHIHVKVHIGGNVVHTGQLFFPDTLTDTVYKSAPYNTRGPRDQRNPNDSIFVNGGSKGLLAVKKTGSGYTGTIAMGVHAA
jgi:protocatechuate 3,4-dioxygenase beta subunit